MNKRILSIQDALEELERFFAGKVPDPKAAATRAMDWVLCVPEDFTPPSLNAALRPWGRATRCGNADAGRTLTLGTDDWDASVVITRHEPATVELTLPDTVTA